MRKIEFPFMALCAAPLFSLPNIHNAAPNTPPIGTQMDMATLFFAIVVIGGCLINNIFRAVYDKPAAKAEEPKPSPPPTQIAFEKGAYGAEELAHIAASISPR
ncbi:hypothetical protein M427DRAFT_181451 [Gonapodya prolifera JEL478]|uniref:Uncharacterized protein n=1 Tax=Gonapodya prolifera (strain JEL478) TaxID=1344416 RepID=A0A139AQJ3_GONPJ|nr:hypothetical protein M427DRAFT_181451 [Gonapodya prolifera JEL478]|eukprot:KXS19027.1 hypothetical protein M427DRAFT_181451 [Gonapodya prolifera JEL478]